MKNLFLLSFFTLSTCAIAQKTAKPLTFDNANALEISPGGVLHFKENTKLSAKQIAANPSAYLGIHKNYGLLAKSKEHSGNEMEHERFTQQFKGIPVEGGELVVHSKGGFVTEANQQLYQIENDAPTKASITARQAIDIALAKHHAQEYYWQNSYREGRAKAKGKSYYPVPELCYLPDSASSHLCYRMYVYSTRPQKALQYFINATTGGVQAIKNMEISCFNHEEQHHLANYSPKPKGRPSAEAHTKEATNLAIINCFNMSVTTPFDGQQLVRGQYDSQYAVPYLSINACNNAVNTIMTTDGYIYKLASNNWDLASNSFSSFITRGIGLVSFGMEKTAGYFSSHFGRSGHGPNNNGVDIDVHFPHDFNDGEGNPNPYNAMYSYDPLGNDDIYVGQGYGENVYDIFGSPDIMGHEYQHGVDAYRASLTYQGESGAIDESFADIFGEAVERYIRGTNDFKIANEVRFNGMMRSFITPNNAGNTLFSTAEGVYLQGTNQPDRYNGFYWKNTANTDDDNGGVHRNSGVQNHMFYLLVNGGSGFTNSGTAHGIPYNNPGYTYSVAGIGWDKAINIAYNAQNYMNSNCTYAQARNAWVQAAVALYGACSHEAIQTGMAWYAVGLLPPNYNYEQVCSTVVLPGGFPYSLGASAMALSSSTYMDVAKLNFCDANVQASGQLLQLSAQTDVLLQPGFSAPEGSNVQVNNAFNTCIFASY